MSGSIFSRMTHYWNRLFARKRLAPYEHLVLDAWRASLPEDGQSIINEQIEAASFVQHQAEGTKVCFFYRSGRGMRLFPLDRPDQHVATVFLRAEGVAELRAKIFLHRGRLFSIEFPKRPERYVQQHNMLGGAWRVVRTETHIAPCDACACER